MEEGTRPATAADLAQARSEHGVLAGLLRRHQEALLSSEFTGALGELEEFARRLRRHIRLEEEVLFPACAALGAPARGGATQAFIAEHAAVLARLDEVLGAARGLSPGSASRAAVRSILEREGRLDALLARHERREERTLFARLAAALGVR